MEREQTWLRCLGRSRKGAKFATWDGTACLIVFNILGSYLSSLMIGHHDMITDAVLFTLAYNHILERNKIERFKLVERTDYSLCLLS